MAVKGTPSWLGDQNARTALTLLLEHGPLSRNRISALSAFSKPTASQMVARLAERGLIEAVGAEAGGRGRNGTIYAVRKDLVYGVAINVDQEGVRSTVIDPLGTDYPIATRVASQMRSDRSAARDVAEAVLNACQEAGVDLALVQHVCIGVPSSVDPRTDELSSVEALPGWSRTRIRSQLEDALHCEVNIDNDVNLAAVAERRAARFDPAATVAVFWIGYGIGLALDIAGTVHHGSSGGAGEIGHLPVTRGLLNGTTESGELSTDIEDIVGAAAIDRICRDLGEDYGFDDVLSGVPMPSRVVETLAPRLALAVIPVLSVLDPDVVVFGGPVGKASGMRLVEATRTAIRNHTRWDPLIRMAEVTGEPVITGAGIVTVQRLRDLLAGRASAPSEDDQAKAIARSLRTIS